MQTRVFGPWDVAGGCVFANPEQIDPPAVDRTRAVFEAWKHANGGCIFDNAFVIDQPDIDRTKAVFDKWKHANGGCIFANAFEFEPITARPRPKGGGGPAAAYTARHKREDEEILAVIMAFTRVRDPFAAI